jgi:hypothetical protein
MSFANDQFLDPNFYNVQMGCQLPATSFSNDQFPGLTNFHDTHTGSQPPPSATSLSNDQFLDPNFYNLQTGSQLPSTSFSND